MNKTCKQLFIACLAILLVIQVGAANDKKISISGHWEGKIDIPQNPMNFNIDFQQDKENAADRGRNCKARQQFHPCGCETVRSHLLSRY